MAANPIVNYIIQASKARGLDPAAVLAVASQEGLSGRIGDNGHAYGPFQLNNAGGVITGTHPAVNDHATQSWASSPAGIDFALDRIAPVARGLKGAQAVQAIVTRFERPANPGREVAGADAAYGQYTPGPIAPQPVRTAGIPTPGAPIPNSALGQLFNTGNEMFGLPKVPNLTFQAPAPTPAAGTAVRPPASSQAAPPTFLSGKAHLSELPPTLTTRPGIQVNQQILPAVQQITAKFGVKVNSGYRSPAHNAAVGGAQNSDHLSGDAVDFTGTPQQMKTLYQWALGQHFAYVEPWAQAQNHVHISFLR